jgi:hypothetical protein
MPDDSNAAEIEAAVAWMESRFGPLTLFQKRVIFYALKATGPVPCVSQAAPPATCDKDC